MQPDSPHGESCKQEQEILPPKYGIATRAVYAGLLGSFLYGFMLCALNSCNGLIAVNFQWCGNGWQSECALSQANSGMVNATLYLGAAFGALLNGRPSMRSRGARFQILISDLFYVSGALIGACAIGVKTLLLSRFTSGLGLGISAIAAPLYIAEVAPVEVRGYHSAKHGLYIAVGLLAAELIGLPQSPAPGGPNDVLSEFDGWYWRMILLFPSVWALLQAVLLLFVVPMDSPSFLVSEGKIIDARVILYRMYGLVAPGKNSQNGKITKLEDTLQELESASIEAKAITRITLLEALRDPFFRSAILVGIFLASYQQLTGINALMAYSNGLFAQAGIPANYLESASVAMCMANVIVSVVSVKLVDTWGRRGLLLLGSSVQTISMVVILYVVPHMPSHVQGIMSMSFFTLFCVSFSFGLGAITWLWLSEVYPMEIRAAALSACGVFKWLNCFLIVLCARFLTLRSSCLTFGGITGIGVLGMWLWVMETKGCSMEDSPMTPRSLRSESSILGPKSPRSDSSNYGPKSPRTDYDLLLECDDENDDEKDRHRGA